MLDYEIDQSSPLQEKIHSQLGYAFQIIGDTNRRYAALNSLRNNIIPPILLNQVHFIFDKKGKPLGFITWAYITEAVAGNLVADPLRILHISEWNEGDLLWVCDVVSPYGFTRELVNSFLRQKIKGHYSGALLAAVRRTDRSLKKIVNIDLTYTLRKF